MTMNRVWQRADFYEYEAISAMLAGLRPGEIAEYGLRSEVKQAPRPAPAIVKDPYSDQDVNVTGWDLDYLAGVLTGLRESIQEDPGGTLTPEEVDVLTGPLGLPEIEPVAAWDYEAAEVVDATDRYTAIVDEAIYQRDLPRALTAHLAGRELTAPEAAAWDRYVREIAEQPA